MLIGMSILSLIINSFQELMVSVWLALGFLALAYLSIFIIKMRKIPIKDTSTITARKILAGERITKQLHFPTRKITLHRWIYDSPTRFQKTIELPNLALLFTAITLYLQAVTKGTLDQLLLRYRLSLGTFLINTFLLKKAQFVSNISRFALALVVNFALYCALLTAGYENLANILPFLILWTFICQIALFYIERLKSRFLFSKKDYQYRTIVTSGATIVNILLLFQLDLPGQFLFFLTFLYAGIELMMLYYILQKLNNAFAPKEQEKKNAELKLT